MIRGEAAISAYGVPLQPRSSALRLRRLSSAAAVVAFGKRQRRWRRPAPEEDDAAAEADEGPEADGGGLEFLSSLDSDNLSWSAARAQEPEVAVSSGGASLRGVDVLQALQHKAAAAPKGGPGKGSKGRRRGNSGGEGPAEARDYSNVRPLEIKSDWADRLEELDRLIQELQALQAQQRE